MQDQARQVTVTVELVAPSLRPPKIFSIRGQSVVVDYDLAPRLGVNTTRLNQQVKRNIERFPPDWAFQLSTEEFAAFKSENPDQKTNHGGRRKPPWVYTEHGVVMAASVLRSSTAVQAMQLVVSLFIAARKAGFVDSTSMLPSARTTAMAPRNDGMSNKLKNVIERLMETMADEQLKASIKDEALSVMHEAVDSIKERLKKPGVENDEIAARATKYLAEAEMAKASAAKTRAETNRIDFDILVRKLRLVMSAQLLLESGDMRSFVGILEDLGRSDE
jgi:hypothetical protein